MQRSWTKLSRCCSRAASLSATHLCKDSSISFLNLHSILLCKPNFVRSGRILILLLLWRNWKRCHFLRRPSRNRCVCHLAQVRLSCASFQLPARLSTGRSFQAVLLLGCRISSCITHLPSSKIQIHLILTVGSSLPPPKLKIWISGSSRLGRDQEVVSVSIWRGANCISCMGRY